MVCIDHTDVNSHELKLLKASYNELKYHSDLVKINWAMNNMKKSMSKAKTLIPSKAIIRKKYELFTKSG